MINTLMTLAPVNTKNRLSRCSTLSELGDVKSSGIVMFGGVYLVPAPAVQLGFFRRKPDPADTNDAKKHNNSIARSNAFAKRVNGLPHFKTIIVNAKGFNDFCKYTERLYCGKCVDFFVEFSSCRLNNFRNNHAFD